MGNHETVVIMTSRPQGIKGSDYIVIDQKGPNIVVERQMNSINTNEAQNIRYNQQQSTREIIVNPIASPATEALEYILEDTKPNIQTNLGETNNPNMDDNSLLLDLNELLRRDPAFQDLDHSKPLSPPQFISSNIDAMNAANIGINNRPGLAIPGSKQNNMYPNVATIVSGQAGNVGNGSILQNRLNLEMGGSIASSVASSSNEKTAFDNGSLGSTSPSFFPHNQPNTRSIPDALAKMDTTGLLGGICISPPHQNSIIAESKNVVSNHVVSMNILNHQIPSQRPPSYGPTLAQLNSPTENEVSGGLNGGIKMEINDIDVIDDLDLFLSSQSANVSLGLGPADIKPNLQEITRQTSNPLSPRQIKQEPGENSNVTNNGMVKTMNYTPLANMNFWQATQDEMIFGAQGLRHPSDTSTTTAGSNSANNSTIPSLSSSVPVNLFQNVNSPLSDILTDLSPPPANTYVQSKSPSLRPAISPNGFIIGSTIGNTLLSPNTQTPSNAGPTRNSTLHKLLMQKTRDGPINGRPSPVRSPEARKTLEQMKNSLSTSNPLISQQLLSRSAPTGNPLGSIGNQPMENNRVWARREPRQHISSVCSVGDSSIADEVNDVLSGLSPNDDLQDIPSDDEDDLTGNYAEYKEESSDGMYIN